MDPLSKDGLKLIVTGMPAGIGWQEMKDHFKQTEGVAFVNLISDNGPKIQGEVRYDTAEMASTAMQLLNGTSMHGSEIEIIVDPNSKDGTKLIVSGMPSGIGWQEMKDHFKQ